MGITKQSRHYCPTCQQKTLWTVDKHPFWLLFFTFGITTIVNLFKKPRCHQCGASQASRSLYYIGRIFVAMWLAVRWIAVSAARLVAALGRLLARTLPRLNPRRA